MLFRLRSRLLVASGATFVLLLALAGLITYQLLSLTPVSNRASDLNSAALKADELSFHFQYAAVDANSILISLAPDPNRVQNFNRQMNTLAAVLLELKRDASANALPEALIGQLAGVEEQVRTYRQAAGQLFAAVEAQALAPSDANRSAEQSAADAVISESGELARRLDDLNSQLASELAATRARLRNQVYQTIAILAGLALLIAAITTSIQAAMANAVGQPITALLEAAQKIGAGEDGVQVQIERRDEIGELAAAFNQMASHLSADRQRLREQSKDIAAQNERYRQGLELAHDIQFGLLPNRVPWPEEDLAIYSLSLPAYEVGGDFYTYVPLADGRMVVAIGDISGKGIGAALMMALTSSAVEERARELESPARVLDALNARLFTRLRTNNMNAALLYIVFDPHSSSMQVANAGMVSPLLIRNGQISYIDAFGLPLGAMTGSEYEEMAVALEPDDLLVLLSDGVVEAQNPEGELFGFERLEATLLEYAAADPGLLINELLDRINVFMVDADQHDDLTIMVIRPFGGPHH